MSKPIIQTTGSVSGVGTAGEGRKDIVIGETIDFSDTVGANAGQHTWTLIDAPPGSSLLVMTNPTADIASIVPDVTGSYTVVCDAGIDRAKIIVGVVLTNSGMRMPGLNETIGDYNEGGNQDSYHPDFIAGLRAMDAALGGGGGGGIVASAVAGIDTTTLSVSGLDGDADGTYEIEGDLILDTAAINIEAQPNGLTADLFSMEAILDVPKVHSAGVWRIFRQAAAVGSYHHIRFIMTLWAARNKNSVARIRSYHIAGEESFDFSATIHNNTYQGSGTLENATSNLASIDFVSSVASGIKAGSEIVVRRIA